MWRLFFIPATLVLIVTSFSIPNLPFLLNTSLALGPFNITSPAPATPVKLTELAYYPWPKQPYGIALQGIGLQFLDVTLVIGAARRFQSSPMVKMPELLRFVQDFADNIQREHPVPGFVPRYATQSTIDVSSSTRWTIVISEGMFRGRLPTAVALAALDQLGKELSWYGPSTVIWLIYEEWGSRFPWASGELIIGNLEGVSLTNSSSHENGSFQIA